MLDCVGVGVRWVSFEMCDVYALYGYTLVGNKIHQVVFTTPNSATTVI